MVPDGTPSLPPVETVGFVKLLFQQLLRRRVAELLDDIIGHGNLDEQEAWNTCLVGAHTGGVVEA